MSEKESKGKGGGQKKTSYECPIPKHWQRQITPKKILKHKKGEDTHIQNFFLNWMKN